MVSRLVSVTGRGSLDLLTTSAVTPVPAGVPGSWTLAFRDEFDGTSLDTTKWNDHYQNASGGASNGTTDKKMNNVYVEPSNVSVANSIVTLKLSDATHGALLNSLPFDSATNPTNGWGLPVGGCVEFLANFGATTSGKAANWPAVWTSGPSWSTNGEIDVGEVLDNTTSGGRLTANYHSGPTANNDTSVPVYQSTTSAPNPWAGGWHTYAAVRGQTTISAYWDGVLMGSVPRTEPGSLPQALILNIGVHSNGTDLAQTLQVDYVRGWTPA